ncbi:phosphoribosylamine--glycine ligase, partial [Chloroflexota bacterium]
MAEGIVDHFQNLGVPIFGPTKAAAQIESSKVFSKGLMQKYCIPCASSRAFSNYQEAVVYVKQQTPPVWIKADGLAAGKGAIFGESIPDALEIIKSLMESKSLGAAGESVVIEECLQGREMSTFVFSDGHTIA